MRRRVAFCPRLAAMTPDEGLRAIAYLQAVWDRDDEAVAALSHRAGGEGPILAAAIDLAEFAAIRKTARDHHLHDGMDVDRLNAVRNRLDHDDTLVITVLLLETLRTWAETVDSAAAARKLSGAVIAFLAALLKASDDEVPEMFALLRSSALGSAQN
jgi:hypothetical protein